MLDGCQGKPRTPIIIEKICPQCGAEIELFSIDTQMACETCGFIAYNDTYTIDKSTTNAGKYEVVISAVKNGKVTGPTDISLSLS